MLEILLKYRQDSSECFESIEFFIVYPIKALSEIK